MTRDDGHPSGSKRRPSPDDGEPSEALVRRALETHERAQTESVDGPARGVDYLACIAELHRRGSHLEVSDAPKAEAYVEDGRPVVLGTNGRTTEVLGVDRLPADRKVWERIRETHAHSYDLVAPDATEAEVIATVRRLGSSEHPRASGRSRPRNPWRFFGCGCLAWLVAMWCAVPTEGSDGFRRSRLFVLALGFALGACGASTTPPSEGAAQRSSSPATEDLEATETSSARPRSAILVVIDSLRPDRFTAEHMSGMTEWARRGVVFDARSSATWAKPSATTLLTSLAPERAHMTVRSARLPPDVVTLPEALKCHGFTTGWFVANHFLNPRSGLADAVDTLLDQSRAPVLSADAVVDQAISWVAAHRNERFFAYVHLVDLRLPFAPPPAYLPEPRVPHPTPGETTAFVQRVQRGEISPTEAQQQWLRQLYDAEVRFLDDQLARLAQAVAAHAPETLVVLTAAHAEALGEDGRYGHEDENERLRGVPLVFVGPGAPQPRNDRIDHSQVAPTIVEALGFALPRRFEASPIGRRAAAPNRPYSYPELTIPMEPEECEALRELGYLASDQDCNTGVPPGDGRDGPCVTGADIWGSARERVAE